MNKTDASEIAALKIRPAEPAHIGELIRIGLETGLSPWTAQNYLDEMRRADSVILRLTDSENCILGFICGRVPQMPHGDAEIFNIAVCPEYRGNGGILLREFLSKCRDRKAAKVWLEVRASNHIAENFYLKNGFVRTGQRKNFYSDPVEDAILMCLMVESNEA
jgi:ribosomal-protein-alanine N-acetyltransferase